MLRHFHTSNTHANFLLASILLACGAMFSWPTSCQADELGELTREIKGKAQRASTGLFDPESNLDAYSVQPGQRRILADLDGPGEIRHLWFTIGTYDRRYPRNLVLRIYYDHSKIPSVETPIGDYFAAGNGMRVDVSTQPIETSSYGRALNSYWRMPFKKHCRIEVHNQGKKSMSIYFHGDWLKLDSLPDDVRYFHARYRQDYPAKPFSQYKVFEIEGEGHYVGTVLSSQNNMDGWFGEADDQFYVDGEKEPSIIGTGTEDYFNDAWNLRLTNNKRVGTTICELRADERRVTAYRWHIDDPIPFKKSLRFEIERRSYTAVNHPVTGKRILYGFKYRPDYWSSVSFWYQKGVAQNVWELPPAEKRLLPEVWVEPSLILDKIKTSEGLKPVRRYNRTCNKKRGFFMENDKLNAWVEFPMNIPKRGRYAASVFPNLFQDRGVWKITLHGPNDYEKVLNPGLDCFDTFLSLKENFPENVQFGTTPEIKLGTHHLQPGDYWVRFTCVGSNPQTRDLKTGEFGKGRGLGLDAINFRRLPIEYPNQWLDDYLKKEKMIFAEKDKTTLSQVRILADVTRRYRQKKGTYPVSLKELTNPNLEEKVLRDVWKQEYQYRSPGVVNPWAFDVYSFHGNSRRPRIWMGNWKIPFKVADNLQNLGTAFEGESLKVASKSDGVKSSPQEIRSYGNAPISSSKHLYLGLNRKGDWANIEIPASLPAGKYKAYIFSATARDYGTCQWSFNGKPLGKPFDGFTETIGMHSAPVGIIELSSNAHTLRVEATGKAEYSDGYHASLDAIVLIPVK